MTIVTVASRGPQGASNGTVTVGTGVGTHGNYNASSYSGSSSLALAAALSASKRVVLLPDTHSFPTAVTVSQDDATIEGYGATLVPTSNTTSTGQLFEVTGDGVRIMGGRLNLTQFTESQYVVRGNAVDQLLICDLIVDDQVAAGA